MMIMMTFHKCGGYKGPAFTDGEFLFNGNQLGKVNLAQNKIFFGKTCYRFDRGAVGSIRYDVINKAEYYHPLFIYLLYGFTKDPLEKIVEFLEMHHIVL